MCMQVNLSENVIRSVTKTIYKPHVDLDLSHNRLRKLPPGRGKKPGIHSIDASYNELTSLPDRVDNLVCMTRLDLSHNKLGQLSVELGLTRYIRHLDLSHNTLTSIPDELCSLGHALDTLSVNNNRLTTLPTTVQLLQVSQRHSTRRSTRTISDGNN